MAEHTRTLDFKIAFAIGLGTMIAAGIFSLSGTAVAEIGSSAVIAFVIAAIVALGCQLPRKENLVPLLQTIFDMSWRRKAVFVWGLLIITYLAGLPINSVHWSNQTPAQQRMANLYGGILIIFFACAIAVTAFAAWKGFANQVRTPENG